jgi:hypothetical protein
MPIFEHRLPLPHDLGLRADVSAWNCQERDHDQQRPQVELKAVKMISIHALELAVENNLPVGGASDSSHQQQDDENDHNQPNAAAWVVAPIPAMRPRRQSAEQYQD